MSEPVLAITGLRRAYKTKAGVLEVLRGLDLVVMPGEIVGLIGPSGSGKSSLLHAAGLLEEPQAGAVTLAGVKATGLGDRARTAMRRTGLGFVYQFHNLLAGFSALDNVALPQLIAGATRAVAEARALELLAMMGLAERASHQPAELSGGEQQRVAIARALANRPRLIIADEPTGNLDPTTSTAVFEVFRRVAREEGASALVATHNLELAGRMDRVFRLDEGRLIPA
jgi:lipoprotein-releasing system ATP-binding protein